MIDFGYAVGQGMIELGYVPLTNASTSLGLSLINTMTVVTCMAAILML